MIYGVLGGIFLAVVIFMGGVKAGVAYTENTTIKADLLRAEKVIVRTEMLVQEVPKIVTKTVTREVEVVKEVERVVTAAHSMLAPDCVLPDNFGLLIVAAANGVDPQAPGSTDEARGRYDCHETLEAVLSDLQAGWVNSARLAGLQSWAKVVSQ